MQIVILQFPKEKKHPLGTARFASEFFPEAVVRVGLSWANLRKATGVESADPKKWGVLHLANPRGARCDTQPELAALDGLIALDGTWSQAKTLWWRNPWLLRLKRVALQPAAASVYGALRPEPRPECVSTLEALAYAIGTARGDAELAARVAAGLKAKLHGGAALAAAAPKSPASIS